MTQLYLYTLGALRLTGPEGDALPGRRKELALLAYLARSAPRPLRREQLATLLWGNRGEARARHSLRQALLTLRKALGSRLEVDNETARVLEGVIVLDIAAAEDDLAAGRLGEATAWWKGEFLIGCEDVGGGEFRTWLEGERATIAIRLSGAFERLVAAARADGCPAEAIHRAERWAGAFPTDEAAHLRWIESLIIGGCIPEARARHAVFSSKFFEELGENASLEWKRLGAALARFESDVTPWVVQGSTALDTPSLVGRGSELQVLTDAVRSVTRHGAGGIIVIEGVEGIGKSRLCEEFIREIEPEHVFLLRAGAGTLTEKAPWASARELLRAIPAAPGLSGASNEDLAEVTRLVPSIRDRFPNLPGASNNDRVLANALTRVLTDLSFEIPLLVYLDDFAVLDVLTRQWFLTLAHDRPAAVLILLTSRTGGANRIEVSPNFRNIPGVRRLKLQPLDSAETEMLLDSMLRLSLDERHSIAGRIHASSGGNPFYITETVAALADQDLITLGPDGSWRSEARLAHRSLPISNAIQRSIVERIAGTSEAAHRILAAAAEVHGPARFATLAKRARLAPDEFHAAMDQLLEHRLLAPAAVPGGGAEFTQELVCRVSRDVLPPPTIRRSERRRRTAIAAVLSLIVISTATAGILSSSPLRVAAIRLAEGFGIAHADGEVAGRSVVTQRLFDEGLTAFNENDLTAANRFFSAALAEDSTFAMAGYYAWMSRKGLGLRVRGDTALVRAARLAGPAPERERLLVRARWSAVLQDPRRYVLAESLAVRFPDEPDGHLLLGKALVARGDFMAAVPHLRRVMFMDSLSLGGQLPQCRACEAYDELISAYSLADSTRAEIETAREWTRRQPSSQRSWTRLAAVLLAQNRFNEARAANQTATSLLIGGGEERIFSARVALRAGNWETADRELELVARVGPPVIRSHALWWSAISFREQGRLRDALASARSYRKLVAAMHAADGLENSGPPYTAVIEAQILLESGKTAAAIALFDSIAISSVARGSPGWTARARAWALTQKATALAAAMDTAALEPLADSIFRIGARSGFGRDWRLHHYVRGLLLARRGQSALAEREFQEALYSVRGGYSRINLELARMHILRGNAEKAVRILLPTLLRGPLEASNLYLTRTELHIAIGEALEQAERGDEAVAHYRWVLSAWKAADPAFDDRRDDIRRRLADLSRS